MLVQMRMVRRGLIWILAAGLLAVGIVACGSDDDSSSSSGTSTSGTQAAQVSGPVLKDCEYATKLLAALTTLATATGSLGAVGSGGAGTSEAFAQIDAQLSKAVADIRALNVPNDFKDFNNEVAQMFTDLQKEFGEAKKLAEGGNTTGAVDRITAAGKTIETRLDGLEKKFPKAAEKLNKCPS
jgi:hypothetical protein